MDLNRELIHRALSGLTAHTIGRPKQAFVPAGDPTMDPDALMQQQQQAMQQQAAAEQQAAAQQQMPPQDLMSQLQPMITQAVQQAVQQMPAPAAAAGGGAKRSKADDSQVLANISKLLVAIANAVGATIPPEVLMAENPLAAAPPAPQEVPQGQQVEGGGLGTIEPLDPMKAATDYSSQVDFGLAFDQPEIKDEVMYMEQASKKAAALANTAAGLIAKGQLRGV